MTSTTHVLLLCGLSASKIETFLLLTVRLNQILLYINADLAYTCTHNRLAHATGEVRHPLILLLCLVRAYGLQIKTGSMACTSQKCAWLPTTKNVYPLPRWSLKPTWITDQLFIVLPVLQIPRFLLQHLKHSLLQLVKRNRENVASSSSLHKQKRHIVPLSSSEPNVLY